jgi:hypothetical protein
VTSIRSPGRTESTRESNAKSETVYGVSPVEAVSEAGRGEMVRPSGTSSGVSWTLINCLSKNNDLRRANNERGSRRGSPVMNDFH